jgi:hypothetical protein
MKSKEYENQTYFFETKKEADEFTERRNKIYTNKRRWIVLENRVKLGLNYEVIHISQLIL